MAQTQDLLSAGTIDAAVLDVLLEFAPLGFGFFDRDIRFRRINRTLAQINGLSVEAHLGRTPLEILPALSGSVTQNIQTVLETGQPSGIIEISGETPAAPGISRHWQASYYPVYDRQSQILGVGAIVLEITDRKEAGATLQEQAQKIAFLYEAGQVIGRTLDLGIVYGSLQVMVARMMDCQSLIVSTYTPEDQLISCSYAWIEGQSVDVQQFPALPLAPEGFGMQSQVIRTAQPRIINDVLRLKPAHRVTYYASADGTIKPEPIPKSTVTRSLLIVPIQLEGQVLGTIQVMSPHPNVYTDQNLQILEALSNQMAAASRNAFLYRHAQEEIAARKRVQKENNRLLQEVQAAATRQRKFLREVLTSLTEGHLRLCDTPADLPQRLRSQTHSIPLSGEALHLLRTQVTSVAQSQDFSEERSYDLMTAASEAAMNAVVHGGGGSAQIHADGSGAIQIWIQDQGAGIGEEAIHRATLERGYSSTGTLGHGFWLMLRTADRCWLLTSPQGTTVVLEQERIAPEPMWLE